jgi:hypothetical protein
MSLNKKQVELINSVFGAFEIDVPEISKGVSASILKAILKAFAVYSKAESKAEKSKAAKKTKDPNAPKKPVNTYFAWLASNRSTLKEQNGGVEEGLSDLLKSEYEKFKKTPAFEKMQKECEEKMSSYKDEMKNYESSEQDPSSDDEDGKKTKGKKTKAKKVEKSPEEKQPPNVYMAFRKMRLETIKAGLSEGANLAEALKESYEEFKKTAEYKTLQDKCKADFAKWKETGKESGKDSDKDKSDESDSDEATSKVNSSKVETKTKKAEAKKPATKKKAEANKAKHIDSDSDDDDTFTMPTEKVAKKKDDKKKKTTKKAAKKIDSDDEDDE